MHRLAEVVSTVLARIAGFAILACAVLITAEVVARKLLHVSFIGADEISGYVLAISVTWGASLALVRRAHVRIDVLHARLPRLAAAALDLLALLSMLAITLLFAWFSTRLLATSLRTGAVSNTPMEVPMWIPQVLWVGGFWIFAAIAVILILATLRALIAGDPQKAHRIAGVRGALEEAQEELAEAEVRR